MKKILAIAGIFAFSFAYAQEVDTFWVKPIQPGSRLFSQKPADIYLSDTSWNGTGQPKLLLTLSNGNKVYALPQDRMPCIVPDMSQYNMPAIKPAIPLYTIPNPAFPPRNGKPSLLSQDELKKKLLELQGKQKK